MTVFPIYHNWQDVVQLEQGDVAGIQDAPPERWVGVFQGNLDLVNQVGFQIRASLK